MIWWEEMYGMWRNWSNLLIKKIEIEHSEFLGGCCTRMVLQLCKAMNMRAEIFPFCGFLNVMLHVIDIVHYDK